MALDWSQCPVVESVPGRRSGAWVFRATRMPVATVFENLEAGASIEEIVEQFHVTPEQIRTVLEFAARSLDPPNAAEAAGFQVLLTTDKNIQYQQNLAGRKISVLVLPRLQRCGSHGSRRPPSRVPVGKNRRVKDGKSSEDAAL